MLGRRQLLKYVWDTQELTRPSRNDTHIFASMQNIPPYIDYPDGIDAYAITVEADGDVLNQTSLRRFLLELSKTANREFQEKYPMAARSFHWVAYRIIYGGKEYMVNKTKAANRHRTTREVFGDMRGKSIRVDGVFALKFDTALMPSSLNKKISQSANRGK